MRSVLLLALVGLTSAAAAQSVTGGTSVIKGGGGSGGGVVTGAIGALAGAGKYMNNEPVALGRDIETRFFGGLHITLQAAKVSGKTSALRTFCYPWLGFRLEGGSSFTYRDRLRFGVGGGWGVNGYMMALDSVSSSVYHSTKNAEVRLAWHTLPKRNEPSQWSFGVGFGATFQRADERNTVKDGVSTRTVALRDVRPYIAPEIGRFTSSGKDRFELALRYMTHFDPAPAWTSTSSFHGNWASTQASDDNLALVIRYHLGVRKRVPPPAPAAPSLEEIAMDTLPKLTAKRQRITLTLWDDAEVDGDTISVLLNDLPVLVAHGLSHEPMKLRLDLGFGYNKLELIAHNEGRIPPNTARAILRRGKGREELLIKTGRRRGKMMVIIRG